MTTNEHTWNKYELSMITLNGYVKQALNFYYNAGRVSIYKEGSGWELSIFNDSDVQVSYKRFKNPLSQSSTKRDVALRSMLNSNGIADKNAPKILSEMAAKLAENEAVLKTCDDMYEHDPDAFFLNVKNPSWFNIMKKLKEIQYIEDNAPYVVDMATFLDSKIIDDNPVCTLDVGAPSSGKSQFIKMLSPGMKPNIYVYPLSDLTSKSMISGLEGNVDLYPLLNKKLVTMEEFTIMISKDAVERGAILGQLRAMYGGHFSKTFGSGVGTKSYDATFGMLCGCTSLIDTIAPEMAIAGERMIKIRRRHNIDSKIHEKIVDAAYDNKVKDYSLTEAIQNEIFSLYEKFEEDDMPEVPEHLSHYIKNCAHITAFLRVAVDRDKFSRGKDMQSEPTIEIGARIVKVYKKLARTIAWMLEKPEVDVEVISYIYRVALDTPTAARVSVLREMGFLKDEKSLALIAESVRLPKNTVNHILEELRISDIVESGSMSTGVKNAEGEDDSKLIDTFYLNVNSILFEYISSTELLLDTLPPEQVHHRGMSASGIEMWNEANYQPISIDTFDYTAHGEDGVHDESNPENEPDTSHLTIDDDPELPVEPEHEPIEEPKEPFVKPHDPNEDVEDEEHNDPNMED